MSEAHQERLGHNEGLFRAVNEEISGIGTQLHSELTYEFVCECATVDCFERLTLSLPEYQQVRERGTRFLLFPGHEDIEVEQVIEDHGRYVVVEKDGVAGLVAEDENPRA